MKSNHFAVYQVKEGAETKELRYHSYQKVREKKIPITVASYEQAYISMMLPTDTAEAIFQRMKKQLPRGFQGHAISVSDVFVLNRDGIITAFYVDPDRLITLAGFIRRSTSGTLISMDTVNYQIDGQSGSWMATDELNIEGTLFFLMENEQYHNNASFAVVDGNGKYLCDTPEGFQDAKVQEMVNEYLHPPNPPQMAQEPLKRVSMENYQKYYENGEYLRAAEMTEEQNYNMIDGRMNNLPTPRVIKGRVSVLDRLHNKQKEIAARSGATPAHQISMEQAERNRK